MKLFDDPQLDHWMTIAVVVLFVLVGVTVSVVNVATIVKPDLRERLQPQTGIASLGVVILSVLISMSLR